MVKIDVELPSNCENCKFSRGEGLRSWSCAIVDCLKPINDCVTEEVRKRPFYCPLI